MLNYKNLRALDLPPVRQKYHCRDSIIYALGIGLGSDPLDPRELSYVQGENLLAFPTMACVLASAGFILQRPETGINASLLVHGEQRLRILRPLPVSGEVEACTSVTRIVDKPKLGALVYVRRELRAALKTELLAVVDSMYFCRGDAGYSLSGQPSDPPEAPTVARHVARARTPDHVQITKTRPEAALLYRLSGDYNALHSDPSTAREAGFDRPILHGLATFGMAAVAVAKVCADLRPDAMASLEARFAAPVFPGETLRTEIWREGSSVAFQVKCLERDILVLTNGFSELA